MSERDVALRVLADCIACAARVAPASWGVSLFQRRLCLNVGRGAVLQFYPDEVLFIVTGRLFRRLGRATRSLFRITGKYAFVQDALEGRLAADKLNRYDLFGSAHTDLIERAAANRRICFWPDAHSSSVIQLLRHRGFSVPTPDYVTVPETAGNRRGLHDVDELDRVTSEGRRLLREHLVAERSPALARRKKEWGLAQKGRLECEICSFDFDRAYGSIGHGFAEVHHLRPLGSSRKPMPVRLSDLAIVCSNCHRMLHRGNPTFTLEELGERFAQNRSAAPNGALHRTAAGAIMSGRR